MGNEASKGGRGGPGGPGGAAALASPSGSKPLTSPVRASPTLTMKVVVRGARRTGKTALLQRLQGRPFPTEYVPTPEIQTATINWTYKNADDKIQVELWDVVDRVLSDEAIVGRVDDDDMPAGVSGSLGSPSGGGEKLDGDHIDVYRGAHAVVVMFDVCRADTWDYVRALVPEIPPKLPVLILANFRDVSAKRAVTLRDVENFAAQACKDRVRHGDDSRVQAFEVSLLDCYGLKVLYNYFNIPYLELKLASLHEQVKAAKAELITVRNALSAALSAHEAGSNAISDTYLQVREEVACYIESQDYDSYLRWRDETRSKQRSDGPITSPGAVRPTPAFEAARNRGGTEASIASTSTTQPVSQPSAAAAAYSSIEPEVRTKEKKPKKDKKAKREAKDSKEKKSSGKTKAAKVDSDDEVAGLAPRPGATAAKTVRPNNAGGPSKSAAAADEFDFGGRSTLDAFLGDDDDDFDPRQAARQKIAAAARGRRQSVSSASSSESASSSSASSSESDAPARKSNAPAATRRTSAAPAPVATKSNTPATAPAAAPPAQQRTAPPAAAPAAGPTPAPAPPRSSIATPAPTPAPAPAPAQASAPTPAPAPAHPATTPADLDDFVPGAAMPNNAFLDDDSDGDAPATSGPKPQPPPKPVSVQPPVIAHPSTSNPATSALDDFAPVASAPLNLDDDDDIPAAVGAPVAPAGSASRIDPRFLDDDEDGVPAPPSDAARLASLLDDDDDEPPRAAVPASVVPASWSLAPPPASAPVEKATSTATATTGVSAAVLAAIAAAKAAAETEPSSSPAAAAEDEGTFSLNAADSGVGDGKKKKKTKKDGKAEGKEKKKASKKSAKAAAGDDEDDD